MKHQRKKIVASIILLALIAAWIFLAGTIGTYSSGWPTWAQLAFFVAAGIGWIIPVRPLFKWMNTGAEPEED